MDHGSSAIGCDASVQSYFIRFDKIYPLISPWIHPDTTGSFAVTDLGTLGGTHNNVTAYSFGINSNSDVVGYSYTNSVVAHAFLSQGTTLTDLGAFTNDTLSFAQAINDNGQIVGFSSGGNVKAAIFSGTSPYDLHDSLAACFTNYAVFQESEALANNNRNEVVGYFGAVDTNYNTLHRPFIYRNGTASELPTLGADGYAYGINDNSQVVGKATTANGYHAFLYNGGLIQDLGTLPGGTHSIANAVNVHGVIVGASDFNGRPITHAFCCTNGVMRDLAAGTSTNATSTALGINSRGDIVGQGQLSNSQYVGFIYKDGKLLDLNTLIPSPVVTNHLPYGWLILSANAINDNGYIAAEAGLLPTPVAHAVLLSPVLSCQQSLPRQSVDSLVVNSGGAKVSFASIPGQQYKVEYSRDLKVWSLLNSLVTATNWSTTVDDPVADSQRFYRLGTLP